MSLPARPQKTFQLLFQVVHKKVKISVYYSSHCRLLLYSVSSLIEIQPFFLFLLLSESQTFEDFHFFLRANPVFIFISVPIGS